MHPVWASVYLWLSAFINCCSVLNSKSVYLRLFYDGHKQLLPQTMTATNHCVKTDCYCILGVIVIDVIVIVIVIVFDVIVIVYL